MLLITEYVNHSDLDVICEQKEGVPKTYKIKGPFLQAVEKNRNGRIYSKSLIEREVKAYNEERIKTKRSFGEMDHPKFPSINLDRVSHLVESLVMEGNFAIGTAKVLDTPKGRIAHTLLEAGTNLGISSRGIGSLTGENVNEDYKMICCDLCADPSAQNSFVAGILENKEWIMDGNTFVEKAVEKLEENLAKHGSRDILNDLQRFLKQITF